MKARFLLLVLIAAGIPAYAAEVYSWTDANGTKHFSDSPPPASANAKKIKLRGSGVTSQEEAPPQVVADATPKPATPPVAPPPGTATQAMVDSPANRAKQCQVARSNLDLLKGDMPVSIPSGEPGKAAVLDDASRKQAVDRATEQVAFYCK